MKNKNALFAPALLCVIYVLTGLSQTLVGFLSGISDSDLLSIIIIQCLVFLLPVAFYCKLRNINFLSALSLKPVSLNMLGFSIISFCLYFTGGAIIKYIGSAFMDLPSAGGIPIYELHPGQTGLVVIAYIVLPAILEEMVFRSIMIHEYSPYGGFFAITVSALSFAMLHFSFSQLPIYFLAGIIFASVTYVSRSVIPAMLLHLANNTVNVFFPDVFSQYVSRTGNSVLLFYILVAIFLLLLYLWFNQLEYIYNKKADDTARDRRAQLLFLESEKKLREQVNRPSFLSRFRQVFLSPGLLAAAAVFILKSLGLI